MLNFDLKHYSGSRLTHLWVSQHYVYKLQQLNGESIDGLIHRKTDQTAFSEMSVIFGVVLYPECNVHVILCKASWASSGDIIVV